MNRQNNIRENEFDFKMLNNKKRDISTRFKSRNLQKNKTKQQKSANFFPLFRLLPNIVTLLSLCLTLTAISFSIKSQYLYAILFLLFAGILDGIDGRLARFLNSASDFGAQLDSLVDFVNFGIAPVFVLYFWINSYGDIEGFDWAMVLFFPICMAIRLARFNVDLSDKNANPIIQKYFFKGVPAPAGATLALLPMTLFFEFGNGFYCNQILVILYVAIIAILMASRLPTISIKKIPIKNNHTNFTMLFIALIITGIFIRPWLMIILICIIYFLSIPVTFFFHRKLVLSIGNIEKEIQEEL